MEIQDQIVKVLNGLNDIGEPVTRQLFAEFMVGKKKGEAAHLADKKRFGSGQDEQEGFWKAILEKCVHEGLAKVKPARSNTVAITPAGKKFRKNPEVVEVVLDDYQGTDEVTLLLQTIMRERRSSGGGDYSANASEHTKLQIKLIHAIDRKISLDEFAEQEHLSLDDIFDELHKLRKKGRYFDVRYFVDEVIETQDTEEILDFFMETGDDLQACIDEWGDVYKMEELRLLHYLYLYIRNK